VVDSLRKKNLCACCKAHYAVRMLMMMMVRRRRIRMMMTITLMAQCQKVRQFSVANNAP
jgi:hypothetical protein